MDAFAHRRSQKLPIYVLRFKNEQNTALRLIMAMKDLGLIDFLGGWGEGEESRNLTGRIQIVRIRAAAAGGTKK